MGGVITYSTYYFSRAATRKLSYSEFGDPKGYPIIFAHGSPGCHIEGLIFDSEAKNFGFRFIVLDRPGMGFSDYNKEQTLLDYPLDVKALAEHLALQRFGVMGWSGGGAPTMACGYVIPDLIDFCIVMGGYTPLDSTEMVSLIPKADKFGYNSLGKPWLFNSMFWLMQWMIKLTPNMYLNFIINTVNRADQLILMKPQNHKLFMIDQEACFINGYQGTALDARITYEPWNYPISSIPARIDLIHGTDDRLVPFAFAKRNASLIKNCHLHALQDEGHLFPMTHQSYIFKQARACLELESQAF